MMSLVLLATVYLATAQPNMAQLSINSTQSRAVMRDFLDQNPTIDTQLDNVSSLPVNTSFSTLFDYILTNSTIYDQIIPNASIVVPFAWTVPLTQTQKQALMTDLFTNNLSMFYSLMVDTLYPINETQCQSLMQAVIGTNNTNYISSLLTTVTGSYFQGKRCVLIYTSYLYIADTLKVNLTYEEKVGLVPTLKRMNVIHKLIFNIV